MERQRGITVERRLREQIAAVRFKLHTVDKKSQFFQVPGDYLRNLTESICTIRLVFCSKRPRIDAMVAGLIFQFFRPLKPMDEPPGCFCTNATFLHMPILMQDTGHRNYNPFCRPLPRRSRIVALGCYLEVVTRFLQREDSLLQDLHDGRRRRFERCDKLLKVWLHTNL